MDVWKWIKHPFLAVILILVFEGYSSAITKHICGPEKEELRPEEIYPCTRYGENYLCPLDVTECKLEKGSWVCPSGDYPCIPGAGGKLFCSPHKCMSVEVPESSLLASYVEKEDGIPCTADPARGYVCPSGSEFPCVKNAENEYVCYPQDMGVEGEISNEGECIGEIRIFEGKASRCRKSGFLVSVDCCDKAEMVSNDTIGLLNEVSTTMGSIRSAVEMIRIGSAAYTYADMVLKYGPNSFCPVAGAFQGYADAAVSAASNAMLSYGTAEEVLQAGLSAALKQYLMGFLSPTNLAIMGITYLVTEMMDMFAGGCDEEDAITAMMVKSGRCVYLGEKCIKKLKIGPFKTGTCVQKAKFFCCFGSELGRIIHENGRPQITSIGGFGSPDSPNCRGFTPEEFSAIDFDNPVLARALEGYFGQRIGPAAGQGAGSAGKELEERVRKFYESVE
jgi:conjugal transfer mating pair stabilization protein TraN